ncbi:MAG: hypothetical protein WDN24_11415 [Sphingomonas sp.]
MATIAEPRRAALGDERFFLTMAFVMAAVIVAGFSFNLAMGRSSFALPLVFHVHAFFFFGWVALYLLQNALVATGSAAAHRRLGWIALLWVPAMVMLGFAVTLQALRTRGGPPFFDQNEFLIGNPLGLLSFAGLVFAAILMRRRTDWHRRLMYSGMAVLTGPAFGRLLPMPFLIPWAWWVAALGSATLFIAIGMIADRRRTGSVHRAWLWAFGALLVVQVATDVIAYSPLGYAITHAVIDGTPGADRGMTAFFP